MKLYIINELIKPKKGYNATHLTLRWLICALHRPRQNPEPKTPALLVDCGALRATTSPG